MAKIQFNTRAGMAFCACFLLFATFFISCSSDNDEPQNSSVRKMRQLTVAEVPITRVTLTDNTKTLGAIWTAGDKATMLNVSAVPPELLYSDLTASSSAATSVFTGSLSCQDKDVVALIYPTVTPVIQSTQNGYNHIFTINLGGQKGTIEDVAHRYHYVYGVGQVFVENNDLSTATATIAPMQSLLADCKFIFTDKATDAVIPVKTVTIEYYDDVYDNVGLGYPLTGTVTVDPEDPTNVVANPQEQAGWNGQKLSITLEDETSTGVYVALFPCGTDSPVTFHFTVTGSSGTYTGTASAKLNAGKYYPVTIKLELITNN